MKYDYNGAQGNTYHVTADVTVTRVGERYELKGTETSYCGGTAGPDKYWALDFGSSAESWRRKSGRCEHGSYTVEINETGRLYPDGRVYLQAGAYGGTSSWGGSWGWGHRAMVVV